MYRGQALIVLGVLALSSAALSRKAQIKPILNWIGAVSTVWGACSVAYMVVHLGWLFNYPGMWLVWLVRGFLLLSLGLVLGADLLKTLVKAPEAQAKLDPLLARLAPLQTGLGIAAVALGSWWCYVHVL